MGKPGIECRVCAHERRDLIELALVHKLPIRVIARRFNIGRDSVFRHRRLHMSPALKAAIMTALHPSEVDLEQLQRSEGENLLAALVSQRARLQQLSEIAFEDREVHAATGVERALTQNLELVAKLLGQIVQHTHSTSTTLLISGEYLRLRSTIIGALRPYPEASQAVGKALATLEAEAAETITNSKKPILLEAQST